MTIVLQLEIQPALIDQVHDRLLAAIADGTLASGQRLTQESVAAMLGVSRQPVSHALQVLKRRGLLMEHGKRGLQVAPIDSRRIRDLYLVREALDGMAARLAARRVNTGDSSEAERKAAQSTLAAGRKLGPRSPISRLIDADVAFHSAIHALSGNQAIVETVADQWPHFRRSMGLVLSVSTPMRAIGTSTPPFSRRCWRAMRPQPRSARAGTPLARARRPRCASRQPSDPRQQATGGRP